MKNSARWVRRYDLGSGQRKLIGKELRAGVQAEYKAVFSRGQMGAIGLQGKRKRPGAAGEHIQQFAGDKRVVLPALQNTTYCRVSAPESVYQFHPSNRLCLKQ